jgi:hypothetical protein
VRRIVKPMACITAVSLSFLPHHNCESTERIVCALEAAAETAARIEVSRPFT